METIYENTSVNTQEEYYQMFAWILPKWSKIGGVVFCVFGALALLLWWMDGEIQNLLSALVLVVGGIHLCRMPRRYGRQQFKKKIEVYGENLPPVTFLFYEDHFRAYDIDSDYTVEYSRVKRIGFLKDCITLMVDPSGSVFAVSRNGFTKGDADRFQSFLQGKCLQSK